jgi:chromatin segregation and condensation protein Rec8/ScpA/Scc1 (kleisin family)
MASRRPKPKRGRPPGKGKPSTGRSLTKPLSCAMQHFIAAYLVRNNATRAYQDAYPEASWAAANTLGSRLLRDVRISTEIRRLLRERAKRLEAKARKIDDILAAKAFASISDVFDQHGAIMQPHQMPREVALAVKKLKRVEIKQAKGKDGEPELVGHTVELEMVDALAAARLLGERLGLFNAQPVATLGTGFAALLEAAGQRVVEAARAELIEGATTRG